MTGGAAVVTLLADIGGTHARFRLLTGGTVVPLAEIAVADHPTLESAIAATLARPLAERPVAAVLAVAGPVTAGRTHLTNAAWEMDAGMLEKRFGFTRVSLVNDFAAVAWSIPVLAEQDLVRIAGGVGEPDAPSIVLGPGTGLGAAAWFPSGVTAIASEAGHISLAASNDREDAVLARLRARFEHVSVERAVSGPGLVNLYEAIAATDGVAAPPRTAPEISAAALAGSCDVSRAALDLFCAFLGTFAGDLALVFGARGGIYLGGGIAPRLRDHLPRTPFLQRLRDKGRFRPWIEAIPVRLIVHPEPAFLGLAHLSRRRPLDGR